MFVISFLSFDTSPNHHATDLWWFGDLLQTVMQRIHGGLEPFSKLSCNGSMVVWSPSPNCHATDPWWFGDLLQTTTSQKIIFWRRSPNYHGSVAWLFGEGLQTTTDPLHGSLEIDRRTAMQHIYLNS